MSAEDVSLAVLTFRVTQCKFAVKSGGHAAFAGASNIDSGVTIDLIHLNQLSLSADKTQASIGAGNVWYDVYTYLQPKNVTVIGGRVSAIGVGGLTLGGGMSFFSSQHGWACDNVNNYEVFILLLLAGFRVLAWGEADTCMDRLCLQTAQSVKSATHLHTLTCTGRSAVEETTLVL
jgi:FAD/FMN-containing dehydrogenase